MSKRTITEAEYSEYQALKQASFDRSINPVLDKLSLDEMQRKRMRIELSDNLKYQDGQYIPLDETGMPIVDAHGWPVSCDTYIPKLAAELFGTAEPAVKRPANDKELFEQMKAAGSQEERVKLYSAYKGG